MTRKDYELLAAAIWRASPTALAPADLPILRQAWAGTAHHVATALAAQNPRFDKARFLTACGVSA